jgi:hypothetical protein
MSKMEMKETTSLPRTSWPNKADNTTFRQIEFADYVKCNFIRLTNQTDPRTYCKKIQNISFLFATFEPDAFRQIGSEKST